MTYTHRNGESEPPTIDGAFYFRGVLGWGNNRKRTENWVHLVSDDIHLFGDETYWSLSDTSGRWWGPIEPPQDNDNA